MPSTYILLVKAATSVFYDHFNLPNILESKASSKAIVLKHPPFASSAVYPTKLSIKLLLKPNKSLFFFKKKRTVNNKNLMVQCIKINCPLKDVI